MGKVVTVGTMATCGCGGRMQVAYIRLGHKGTWTAVGTLCRQCWTFKPYAKPSVPPAPEAELARLEAEVAALDAEERRRRLERRKHRFSGHLYQLAIILKAIQPSNKLEPVPAPEPYTYTTMRWISHTAAENRADFERRMQEEKEPWQYPCNPNTWRLFLRYERRYGRPPDINALRERFVQWKCAHPEMLTESERRSEPYRSVLERMQREDLERKMADLRAATQQDQDQQP